MYKFVVAQHPEIDPIRDLRLLRNKNVQARDSLLKELGLYVATLKSGKRESRLHTSRIFDQKSKMPISELASLWANIERICYENERAVYKTKAFTDGFYHKGMDPNFAAELVDKLAQLSESVIKRFYMSRILLVQEDISFFKEFPKARGLSLHSLRRVKRSLKDAAELTKDETKCLAEIKNGFDAKHAQLPKKSIEKGLIFSVFGSKTSGFAEQQSSFSLEAQDSGYCSGRTTPDTHFK